MFTGGFSPSTYCQQFKGLSVHTLCVCVLEAEGECVWRGQYRHPTAVKKTNTRYIRNLKSTLIIAECDACQASCQSKCWRCTPHRVVSLKHTFVYMSIWNFLLCHSLLHPQLQDTQQFIVHALSSHPCQAEMTKTGVEFYYDRVPRGMEVHVHLIIEQLLPRVRVSIWNQASPLISWTFKKRFGAENEPM